LSVDVKAAPVAAELRGRGGGLFVTELRIMFRRWRHLAILAVLAGVPVLIAVAVRLFSAPNPGEGPPLLDQVTNNGLFVGLSALIVCIPFFLPLAIGVVAGDTLAGESNLGTVRYLLLAPAGRSRLLLVKYLSTLVFCLAATLTVVVVGAVIGWALFGGGSAVLLSGDTISNGDALLRALLMAAYVTVSLAGMSAIGLFISTITEVPVGAMAATVTVAIAAQVVGSIPQLSWLHPWLFTDHWLQVADLLRNPIAWGSFGDNLIVQAAYVLVFGALAWARFTSKDVLS
jgi:ABC-2 type transport system permease protein